jgi:hypothetical protein
VVLDHGVKQGGGGLAHGPGTCVDVAA